MEILCVVAVMGTMFGAGVPHMYSAFEGARTDEAGGVLRGLWNAERMYWLEQRTFTDDIDALIAYGFIDAAVKNATTPFAYAIVAADATSFSVEATRTGSDTWAGTLTIDESSVITGEIEDEHGEVVQPYQG